MAMVQVAGVVISADPIRQLENGDWLMTANGHGPRFHQGVEIRVKPTEIIEMAAAEMPILPPPFPPFQDSKPMTTKLEHLAALATDTHKLINAEADKAIDRLTTSKKRADAGMSKIHSIADGYDKGANALDAFAAQVSNLGPLDET